MGDHFADSLRCRSASRCRSATPHARGTALRSALRRPQPRSRPADLDTHDGRRTGQRRLVLPLQVHEPLVATAVTAGSTDTTRRRRAGGAQPRRSVQNAATATAVAFCRRARRDRTLYGRGQTGLHRRRTRALVGRLARQSAEPGAPMCLVDTRPSRTIGPLRKAMSCSRRTCSGRQCPSGVRRTLPGGTAVLVDQGRADALQEVRRANGRARESEFGAKALAQRVLPAPGQ
jgi:hypothetical protein